MVRVNLLHPKKLADQHLIAEYNEILMLVAYIRKHSSIEDIPTSYCLNKGHMKFFKNKLAYLKKRHEHLKAEMKVRGFQANKTISLKGFGKNNVQNWTPTTKDFTIITKRITEKLRMKPTYYRYYGKYKDVEFLVGLLISK